MMYVCYLGHFHIFRSLHECCASHSEWRMIWGPANLHNMWESQPHTPQKMHCSVSGLLIFFFLQQHICWLHS